MLSEPTTSARHHQSPRGRRRSHSSMSSPTGRARTVAAKSGRPGGSHSWVTAYVDPQIAAGSAARATVLHDPLLPSMEDKLPSEEDIVQSHDPTHDAADAGPRPARRRPVGPRAPRPR